MLKTNLALIVLLFSTPILLFSQSAGLPMNDFYKRQFLQHSGKEVHENFFPANETQLNLHTIIRDSSEQKKKFGRWFFQKHWVEINKERVSIYISPLVDVSMGVNLGLPIMSQPKLFRNTRGVYAGGRLGKRISFMFSFAENQGRYMPYESAMFKQSSSYTGKSGEYKRLYATIPGGGPTKEFKADGYDFSYSIGMINIQATDKLRFEFGNQQNFIGAGYRSLLLSDNAINALGLRAIYKFNAKWSYQLVVKNHRNLYLKPKTRFGDAPYENKLFSAVYLSYKPIKNLSLSLYSGANALLGDSTRHHSVQWQSVLPLPFINTDVFIKNKVMNGIFGLNLEWALQNWRFYGQLVADNINGKITIAGQVGGYYFNAFTIKNWTFQLEGNIVPQGFYANQNSKLSYSHAQIALAHPKGNNFAEILVRSQYEWKRIYAEFTGIYYHNIHASDLGSLGANAIITQTLPTPTLDPKTYASHYEKLEIGWRFNRKYNGMIYMSFVNRAGTDGTTQRYIMAGLRTSIFNHYYDF